MLQALLKKPMLVIGIILFGLFLAQETTVKWWNAYKARFIPNTCMTLKSRLDEKIPSHWSIECPGTEKLVLNVKTPETPNSQKFKMLANVLVTLATKANPETLELLGRADIYLRGNDYALWAVGSGQDIVVLRNIKDNKLILEYLNKTIKVKPLPLGEAI